MVLTGLSLGVILDRLEGTEGLHEDTLRTRVSIVSANIKLDALGLADEGTHEEAAHASRVGAARVLRGGLVHVHGLRAAHAATNGHHANVEVREALEVELEGKRGLDVAHEAVLLKARAVAEGKEVTTVASDNGDVTVSLLVLGAHNSEGDTTNKVVVEDLLVLLHNIVELGGDISLAVEGGTNNNVHHVERGGDLLRLASREVLDAGGKTSLKLVHVLEVEKLALAVHVGRDGVRGSLHRSGASLEVAGGEERLASRGVGGDSGGSGHAAGLAKSDIVEVKANAAGLGIGAVAVIVDRTVEVSKAETTLVAEHTGEILEGRHVGEHGARGAAHLDGVGGLREEGEVAVEVVLRALLGLGVNHLVGGVDTLDVHAESSLAKVRGLLVVTRDNVHEVSKNRLSRVYELIMGLTIALHDAGELVGDNLELLVVGALHLNERLASLESDIGGLDALEGSKLLHDLGALSAKLGGARLGGAHEAIKLREDAHDKGVTGLAGVVSEGKALDLGEVAHVLETELLEYIVLVSRVGELKLSELGFDLNVGVNKLSEDASVEETKTLGVSLRGLEDLAH
mmetsp:Transcript_6795/g.13608  ORF Transcript_6795/g.13608 Transcript_6795/m.13608 type:complete len:571 (-) Transcript_6795:275-1987(-)